MNRDRRAPSIVLRDDAGDADVTLADQSWSGVVGAAGRKMIPDEWKTVILSIFSTAAADQTFTAAELWGYVKGGQAQLLWTGSGIVGADLNDDGLRVVDTITTVSDHTIGGVSLLDATGSSDRLARVAIPVGECEFLYFTLVAAGSGVWTIKCNGISAYPVSNV